MKCIKDYNINTYYICNNDTNIGSDKYTLSGRRGYDEYRTLIRLDLNTLKELSSIPNNIQKVELCIYLLEMRVQDYMDCFMLNLGINLEDFYEDVSYHSAPKFYQQCSMFILKKQYQNQYVNLDITNIISEYLSNSKENYGLTLLGINDNGASCFTTENSEKKPYLKIYYNKEVYITEKEEIKKSYYGFFVNDTGYYLREKECAIIPWTKVFNRKGINLSSDNSSLIIAEKGMYQVDYLSNIRCNRATTMLLILNGIEVPFSRYQIGLGDQVSCGNIILNVEKDRSILKLIINNPNILLIDIGVCASIRIIKI